MKTRLAKVATVNFYNVDIHEQYQISPGDFLVDAADIVFVGSLQMESPGEKGAGVRYGTLNVEEIIAGDDSYSTIKVCGGYADEQGAIWLVKNQGHRRDCESEYKILDFIPLNGRDAFEQRFRHVLEWKRKGRE